MVSLLQDMVAMEALQALLPEWVRLQAWQVRFATFHFYSSTLCFLCMSKVTVAK
jgi:hypothetical protein